MRPRQVYVIEWQNKQDIWEPWEIHGHGGPCSEGGGLPFYKKRLRQSRQRWPMDSFRLVRYVPETPVPRKGKRALAGLARAGQEKNLGVESKPHVTKVL